MGLIRHCKKAQKDGIFPRPAQSTPVSPTAVIKLLNHNDWKVKGVNDVDDKDNDDSSKHKHPTVNISLDFITTDMINNNRAANQMFAGLVNLEHLSPSMFKSWYKPWNGLFYFKFNCLQICL